MTKRIIVFSGKQYSGKDTAAKILLEAMPEFKRIGLGDAIKIEYGKTIGKTFEEIEAQKHLYRADLIKFANEKRAIDQDYWIKKIVEYPYDVIVPDMRVKREYDFFKSQGAYMVRVNASVEARSKRGTLVKADDPTETALDNITDWDFVIDNETDYETLKVNTQALIKDYVDKVKSEKL